MVGQDYKESLNTRHNLDNSSNNTHNNYHQNHYAHGGVNNVGVYSGNISLSSKDQHPRPNSAFQNLTTNDIQVNDQQQQFNYQNAIAGQQQQTLNAHSTLSRRLFAPSSTSSNNGVLGAASSHGSPQTSSLLEENNNLSQQKQQQQNNTTQADKNSHGSGDSIFSRPPCDGFGLESSPQQLINNSGGVLGQQPLQQQLFQERYNPNLVGNTTGQGVSLNGQYNQSIQQQKGNQLHEQKEQQNHSSIVGDLSSQGDQSLSSTYNQSNGSVTQRGATFRSGPRQKTNDVMIHNIDKATISYIAQELHQQDVIDISQSLIARNILIVRFATQEGAQWAINKYDGQTINNRQLQVTIAVDTTHVHRNKRHMKQWEQTNLAQINETNDVDEDVEQESSVEMLTFSHQLQQQQFSSPQVATQYLNSNIQNMGFPQQNQNRSKSTLRAPNATMGASQSNSSGGMTQMNPNVNNFSNTYASGGSLNVKHQNMLSIPFNNSNNNGNIITPPPGLTRPQTVNSNSQDGFALQMVGMQPQKLIQLPVSIQGNFKTSQSPFEHHQNYIQSQSPSQLQQQQFQQQQFGQNQVFFQNNEHHQQRYSQNQPQFYNPHQNQQEYMNHALPNQYQPIQQLNPGTSHTTPGYQMHQGLPNNQNHIFKMGSVQEQRPGQIMDLGKLDQTKNQAALQRQMSSEMMPHQIMIDQPYPFPGGAANQQLVQLQIGDISTGYVPNWSSSVENSQQDLEGENSFQLVQEQPHSGSERGSFVYPNLMAMPTRNNMVTTSTRNSDSDNSQKFQKLQFYQTQQFQSPISARKAMVLQESSFEYHRNPASNSGHDTPPPSYMTPGSNKHLNNSFNQMNGGNGTSSQQSLTQMRTDIQIGQISHNRNLSHNQQLQQQLAAQHDLNPMLLQHGAPHHFYQSQQINLQRSVSYANVNTHMPLSQSDVNDFSLYGCPTHMTQTFHHHQLLQPQEQLAMSSSNSSFDVSSHSVPKSKKKCSFNKSYQSHKILKHQTYSELANSSLDQSMNELDLEKIRRGEDTRTTLMVRHIPNKYYQKLLLSEINKNHQGKYDFFYLPIDYQNQANVGYAFLNFVHHIFILDFFREFHNRKWANFNSKKRCDIKYGRIQGLEELKKHFQSSSVMNQTDENFRPRIFEQHNKMDWTAEVKKINEKYTKMMANTGSQPKSTHSQSSHAQTSNSQYHYQQSVGSSNTTNNNNNAPQAATTHSSNNQQSLSSQRLTEEQVVQVEELKEN